MYWMEEHPPCIKTLLNSDVPAQLKKKEKKKRKCNCSIVSLQKILNQKFFSFEVVISIGQYGILCFNALILFFFLKLKNCHI